MTEVDFCKNDEHYYDHEHELNLKFANTDRHSYIPTVVCSRPQRDIHFVSKQKARKEYTHNYCTVRTELVQLALYVQLNYMCFCGLCIIQPMNSL